MNARPAARQSSLWVGQKNRIYAVFTSLAPTIIDNWRQSWDLSRFLDNNIVCRGDNLKLARWRISFRLSRPARWNKQYSSTLGHGNLIYSLFLVLLLCLWPKSIAPWAAGTCRQDSDGEFQMRNLWNLNDFVKLAGSVWHEYWNTSSQHQEEGNLLIIILGCKKCSLESPFELLQR